MVRFKIRFLYLSNFTARDATKIGKILTASKSVNDDKQLKPNFSNFFNSYA
jgi:hypothetical protein